MTWQPLVLEPAACGHYACRGKEACVYPPDQLVTEGEAS